MTTATFTAFDGTVAAPFEASDQEITRELLGVLEAVRLKPVRLTKTRIPPKPLWTAINQRLVWKDPPSILYDWEEADQVRLVYLLAWSLRLIAASPDDWLQPGPGADAFFLASAAERAQLLWRAFVDVLDWDERIDARDQLGHRCNFGHAFRRDFALDPGDVRLAVFSILSRIGPGWVRTTDIARTLSQEHPDLLCSEVGELPELDAEGIDPEKLRFVNHWFTLLARFGWADLARAPGDDNTRRLARLTPLGRSLVFAEPHSEVERRPITIDPQQALRLRLDRLEATDRYVAVRLSEGEEAGADRGEKRFRLTPESLERAANEGVDLAACLLWLRRRSDAPLDTRVVSLFENALARRGSATVLRQATLVELCSPRRHGFAALHDAGFAERSGFILAAPQQIHRLFHTLGGNLAEGFEYPLDEGVAAWQDQASLQLFYEELPLQHRDLLVQLGAAGDPPIVELTPQRLSQVRQLGWQLDQLVRAFEQLTLKPTPPKTLKALEEMWDA